MLITLLIFFVILLALVLSHEAGHFFSALFFGIKVEEFGFGIPPRMFGVRSKKGILYSFNWLPLGGFVKITGEDGGESADPSHFSNKSSWVRTAVLASGVLMNLFLAYVIFSAVAMIGTFESVEDKDIALYPDARVMIVEIAINSPAGTAKIEAGDVINNMVSGADSVTPKTIDETQKFIEAHKGKEILAVIGRGKTEFQATMVPRADPPAGEGPLGVALSLVRVRKIPFYLAPIEGAQITWGATTATLQGFWTLISSLITGGGEAIQVSGPVGIYNLTGQATSMGMGVLLTFIALLSINLAIINVLPIPGLDGGRLLFVAIEAIRGRKISSNVSSVTHGIGLALLIVLILFITFNDIKSLF
ncbi:MAG: site-2 protease family protein [bacterium]|nr:site-2 protease family protein [bacterium]